MTDDQSDMLEACIRYSVCNVLGPQAKVEVPFRLNIYEDVDTCTDLLPYLKPYDDGTVLIVAIKESSLSGLEGNGR
jgi:hypothetical protein